VREIGEGANVFPVPVHSGDSEDPRNAPLGEVPLREAAEQHESGEAR
jgi:hypothetical protein